MESETPGRMGEVQGARVGAGGEVKGAFGTLSYVANLLKALAWLFPTLAVIIIAYAVASGRFAELARLLQGYKVTQVASIDDPILLPSETFRDYRAGIAYKSFPTSQSDAPVTTESADIVGKVIAWRFHVQGYAAAEYDVFYDDTGGDRAIHTKLCDFDTETTDDSYMLCTYWVPPSHAKAAESRPRVIVVWLDNHVDNPRGTASSYAPVAVRSVTLDPPRGTR